MTEKASVKRRVSTEIKARRSRMSTTSQQTFPSSGKMTNSSVLSPLRPADPSVFIQAGTSGLRHLLPIHLTESNLTEMTLSRSISRLRSRTPTTKLCTNIEMIRNICLTIPTLQQFDISENNLDEFPLELNQLVQLEIFDCSHNRLSQISSQFDGWTKLVEIDLSYNQFRRFPSVLCTFIHLQRLNAEHNLLRTLDEQFSSLRALKSLVLDHNQIQSLESIDFQHLTELESIHLAQNQLTKFPRNVHLLKHLTIVNLSFNQLSSFPIELLLINTLDVLNLSHNQIEKLSPLSDIYKRTTLIFSIDLSFNHLTKFYDYLLLICRKVDLCNNRIQSIPHFSLDKLPEDVIRERELKLHHNPILQSNLIPADLRVEMNSPINILPFLNRFFQDQSTQQPSRQGFQLSLIGPKNSGKTALTYCLEENTPWIVDEDQQGKQQRMLNIHQFPFPIESIIEPIVPSIKLPPVSRSNKSASSSSNVPSKSMEITRSIPMTVFDFSGSSDYFQWIQTFINPYSLHLLCVHSMEFHQITPTNVEEIFSETFVPSAMINEILHILQLIGGKASQSRPIVIIPVATHIDLFDKHPKEMKIELVERINRFFQIYLQTRLDRLKNEIATINCLSTISTSLSERLKTLVTLLNTSIHIESCRMISSLTLEGLIDLQEHIRQTISHHKMIYPHIDRVLPRLWAETNQHLESLADRLSFPYLFWENFCHHITEKHGLTNLVDQISTSLEDQGKILVLKQLITDERVVFLRPLWLADLLSALFCEKIDEADELYREGLLHSDVLRRIWSNFIQKSEIFYSIWLIFMRFLFLAYPKINPKQLRSDLHFNDLKFDYAIVPFYLPSIEINEREKELKQYFRSSKHSVSISFRCPMFPSGLVDQLTVSMLFQLPIIYVKHWKNFLLAHHEEKQVKFALETDQRTYLNCHCGTKLNAPHGFDQIWHVVLLFTKHFETFFRRLAPNQQYDRWVRCPKCLQFSFMGEWNTPRDLQNAKTKSCSLCSEEIETSYLIQPNETRRRNEQILAKIREKNAPATHQQK